LKIPFLLLVCIGWVIEGTCGFGIIEVGSRVIVVEVGIGSVGTKSKGELD
jgi:hypothetical protein